MTGHSEHVAAADRLAALLGDQRGTETIRALRQLAPPAPPARPRRPPARPRSIGAWEITDTGTGAGLRRNPVSLWESCTWSGVESVPGKGPARRVVLLGESVARGYLLDPVFTPAMSLQRQLDCAGGGPYQCVDLAQISINLPNLRRLVRRSAFIETDDLVLFAGNNWMISADELSRPQDGPRLAEALATGGYAAMRQAFRSEVLVPQVQELLGELLELRDRSGVRPVVVVPEFNLAGFSPLGATNVVDVAALPERTLRQWCDRRDEAVAALTAGAWDRAAAAAHALAELDGGLSPVPGWVLGRVRMAAGDGPGARLALEESRDAVCGLLVKYLPRTPRVLQDLLVDFCREHAVECVDLRTVLGGADLPEVPDPRHFLDYCHLSDSGIEVAMAAVAHRISGSAPPAGPPVEDWTRAVSQLLAGAYNSFCGQPAGIVAGYLRAAVEACPRITGLMESFDRIIGRPDGPMWSAADFPELQREPNAASLFERLSEYRPDKARLWTLRESLADVLDRPFAAGAEPAPGRELLDVSTTMLGVGAVPNYTPVRCYLQANTATTRVRLVLGDTRDHVLQVVARRRDGPAEPVRVLVNSTPVGSFVVAAGWTTVTLDVPAAATRRGLNEIAVIWPGPSVGYPVQIAADVAALARGEHPYVLPLFGELFSMVLDPAVASRPRAAGALAPAGGGQPWS